MKKPNAILSLTLILLSLSVAAHAQKNATPAENAALRYWSAFSQVRDSAITDQQAKELNEILDGTAPYDDANYRDLVEKNGLALEIMARGTALPNCDWGLDYALGSDLPIDYARKALVLGRLNVLNALHLLAAGKRDGGVRALAAGLRFSHDVGNGGSLFATLIAKDLLTSHLRAIDDAARADQISGAERAQLREAVIRLGEGLNWEMAARRDLDALHGHYSADLQASAALDRIVSLYVAALQNQSKISALDQAIDSAPQELAGLIPSAKKVLAQKEDLTNRLSQTRALLR